MRTNNLDVKNESSSVAYFSEFKACLDEELDEGWAKGWPQKKDDAQARMS